MIDNDGDEVGDDNGDIMMLMILVMEVSII